MDASNSTLNSNTVQAELALDLAKRGFRVFPVNLQRRASCILNWPIEATTFADGQFAIVEWWNEGKFTDKETGQVVHPVVGIAAGRGIVVIDCDAKHNGPAQFHDWCVANGVDLRNVPTVSTPSGGYHLYFRTQENFKNSVGEFLPGVDVRSFGGMVLAPGVVREDGVYTHVGGNLDSPDTLPELPEALTSALPKRQPGDAYHLPEGDRQPATEREKSYADKALKDEFDKLCAMQSGSGRNYALNRAAFSLGTMVGAGWLEAEQVEATLSAAAVKNGYVAKDGQREAWNTIQSGLEAGIASPRSPLADVDHGVDFGGLKGLFAPNLDDEVPTPAHDGAEEHGQAEIAVKMMKSVGNDTISIAGWGWHQWDGHKYKKADEVSAFKIAARFCRDTANHALAVAIKNGASSDEIDKMKTALKAMNSAAYVASVRTHYQSRVTVGNNLFDADPAKLNTTAGVYDLINGVLKAGSFRRYSTKAAVGPDWDMNIAPWLDLLKLQGDADFVGYHQRIAYYCCTGLTEQDAMFFLHGDPGVGKSTFFNILGKALGDYAHMGVKAEMFLISKLGRNEHPTGFAEFAGKRIVVVDELPKAATLNTSLLNQLTSGTGRGRFMRQDYFEYPITHKLTFTTNHQPKFYGSNDGFVRRVHMPHWANKPKTIDTNLRDKTLPSILPGILAWALNGREAYQREGLTMPAAVRAYTSQYLQTQDTIQQWIEERCDRGRAYSESSSVLFANWKQWADSSGFYVGNTTKFKINMLNCDGIEFKRGMIGSLFTGVRLKGSIMSAEPQPVTQPSGAAHPDWAAFLATNKKGKNQ